MYSYEFDTETGGLLLTSSPAIFSKEPRPVYAPELDMLGFSKFMKYSPQTDYPYMWAESANYFYRGVKVATVSGGNLYTAPSLTLTPEGGELTGELEPADIPAMCAKNSKILDAIEDATVKRIVDVYERYAPKVDVFHVAFSGGKDSAVLLDLVKKSLPEKSFVVVFGDTGMEFPDTYRAVEVTREMCRREDIPFYTARSHMKPEESWRIFGPPAQVLRWCCSVHKSAPQTLKLREILGKNDYVGMDFVGVRWSESLSRSKYKFLNYGEKQQGQYSYNAILDWTSAEIWLYIFRNSLYVNEAYKKGNSRAGCLLCPMTGGHSAYVRRYSYTDKVDEYISIIRELNVWDEGEKLDTYITGRGWNSRRSGRGIRGNQVRYRETKNGGKINIEIINPLSEWGEWIKTANTDIISYTFTKTAEGFIFTINEADVKRNPTAGKIFRQALKKAAYCTACRVCESNCPGRHIIFRDGGKVEIRDCTRCCRCHEITGGCLMYNSLKISEGENAMKSKSINCFDDHAPQTEWLKSFFSLKNDFFTKHSLGPNMFSHFKRFLKDAQLAEKNNVTGFAELIIMLGWDEPKALGLMLTNLAYSNAQFDWYIRYLDIGTVYRMQDVKKELLNFDMKEKGAASVAKSFKRIVSTPFGTVLHFGTSGSNDELIRTECTVDDNRVLLYALYKFAEKCNLDREFSLAYLFADDSDRDGISPVRIFGLHDTEGITGIRSRLLGLSAAYPGFINVTFTNDLQTITLRDKTPEDVLELFRKG